MRFYSSHTFPRARPTSKSESVQVCRDDFPVAELLLVASLLCSSFVVAVDEELVEVFPPFIFEIVRK